MTENADKNISSAFTFKHYNDRTGAYSCFR
jgi:hypothetical protein